MTQKTTLDPNRDHTFILIKPDGYARGLTGEVLRRIEAKGYVLKALKIQVASEELLSQHYAEHNDRPFYGGLVDYMSSGPCVAVIVEGNRVVEGLRSLMGSTDPTSAAPGTIRGDFGRDWGDDKILNIIHGSDSEESADREIALWFPEIDL